MHLPRRTVFASAGAFALSACTAPDPQDSGHTSLPQNGSTPSDTSQLIQQCARTGATLPAGNYRYTGPGLTGPNLTLLGAGRGVTHVELAPGAFLIDDQEAWETLTLSGITVSGGAGAIRSRRRDANVAGIYMIKDCQFFNYTQCAISNNSTDMPYWQIENNVFRAANSQSTLGVALSGLTDGSAITNNKFLTNRIHLKLDRGGNNTYVRGNDFIQFDQGSSRVSLWVVPSREPNNSGAGLVLESCKFGNENLSSSDRRVLYADEGDGDSFGQRLPSSQTSAGYITGHTLRACLFNGADNNRSAPVTSMTPHVRACHYGPVTLAGTAPTHFLEFPKKQADSPASNVVGPILLDDLDAMPTVSNVPSSTRSMRP